MIPLRDNLACKSAATVTFLLIALNFVAFGIQLFVPESAQESFFATWAFTPKHLNAALSTGNMLALGMAAVTAFTSMFLHGGLAHILGNMIFLQAFGKAVENRFGAWRFLGFYLLGGLAAVGFQYAVDPQSPVPMVGASGAIAAVLGGYLLFYPKAEFRALFFTPLPIMADVRAYWLLIVWFAGQIMPGVSELLNPSMGGGIAYWAHIGGFIGGLALAAFWAWRVPASGVCYAPIQCDCNSTCTKHRLQDHLRRFLGRIHSGNSNCGSNCSDGQCERGNCDKGDCNK